MRSLIIGIITTVAVFNMAFAYSYAYKPYIAENGDLYNWDNDGDNKKESIYVQGYYKKDGTYVRGHYRH